MSRGHEPSDAELLAVAGDDPAAFAAFYRRHEEEVVVFLRRRTDSPELAADLAAEVFAAVLIACRRDTVPVGHESAWLFSVAEHKLIDSYRRGRVQDEARRRLAMRPVVLSDETLERIEALVADSPVLELVRALPGDQRDAVTAHVVQERSYREIAAQLGLSEQVVRQRVSRGLRRLRRAMGQQP
jgi:RNA polymerase sigma-70 factor (ECF subfamily)